MKGTLVIYHPAWQEAGIRSEAKWFRFDLGGEFGQYKLGQFLQEGLAALLRGERVSTETRTAWIE